MVTNNKGERRKYTNFKIHNPIRRNRDVFHRILRKTLYNRQ